MNGSYKLFACRAAVRFHCAKLAVALMGTPNSHLSTNEELRFGRRGSLAVVITGVRAGTWFDHENGVGGDLFDLIRRQNGGSFRHAVGYVQHLLGHGMQTDQGMSHSSTRRRSRETDQAWLNYQRHAMRLWNEGRPIAETIAARYLAIRGIAKYADIDGEILRFHPSCPYGEKARLPCMLALLRDVHTNEPCAIQRTALTKAGAKIGRRTLGAKSRAAIKLSADEAVTMGLTVGEGLETVLSAMQLGFTPAWALGDSGNVRAFPVLSGVECLTIIVDNDESNTGQQAALECSSRWTSAGREVFRVIPDRCGEDMNDVARRVIA